MTDADFRNAVRGALRQHDRAVEDAIRLEVTKPITLGPRERLQFEVDPHSYSVHLVQTEEGIVGDLLEALPDSLFETAEAEQWDLFEMLGEELFPWLADRWQAVGGPARFSPAYAFYHGGPRQPRYHLEQRRWCSVEEVWPPGS